MRLVILLFLFSIISCKETDTKQANLNLIEETDLKPSKADIDKFRYSDFLLDARARDSSVFWQKYDELQNIISQVKQADLSFFKDNNEIVTLFISDLKKELPEKINSPLVYARLTALETIMLKLEGVVNLDFPDKETLLPVIKDFLVSFSNLNLQINKKIEKDSQNIQKP